MPPIFFDPYLMLATAPAVMLAMWAQWRVHSSFTAASHEPAPLTGAAAARHILDSAGATDVAIEPTHGMLSDHYDPQKKVLRLSEAVYGTRSLAAVGIAAHEAGHAIQDATHYVPLVIRNLAVPAAQFGGSFGMMMLFVGLIVAQSSTSPLGGVLCIAGIVLFAAVAFFQLINLPVEFNASCRAKQHLVDYQIVNPQEMGYVDGVLDSAAWTYVGATLQAVLTLVYLVVRFGGNRE